jgi:alkanesulfonate monooxygenase SsuD/methylene tetrahydromethanopterin reductase-like flavin-dependent oxidoreductase (luciferase family)
MIAWLLASTQRMRVGSGVLVLPLHSIPRLGEQLSTLHHASHGRVLVGVGAGYQASDFATFGVSLHARGADMDRGLRGLRAAWATGELDGRPIRPSIGAWQPPELFVGAWSDAGIRRAARLADGWIADPIRTVDETAAASARYLDHVEPTARPGQVMVMREAWVAETDADAVAAFDPVIGPVFRYYLRNGAFPGDAGLGPDDLTLSAALADRVICGSSATVIDRITRLVERTRANSVVLGLRHPSGPAHDEVLAAIEVFGREVLPKVRSRLAASSAARSEPGPT